MPTGRLCKIDTLSLDRDNITIAINETKESCPPSRAHPIRQIVEKYDHPYN